ncbi:50S ribosome-binding GTPase [Burkholderia vietnamiensis]|uniref:YcjF family protein n=1 Tax=Burkholderia TaxID=32008 RepID=UPI000F06A85F|nr:MULTISPECIES: GTPase [Burkholderia]MBR8087530.1 50S ribosome-binding GTPase [Burkholderia vietnamiensis]VCS85246.1 tRNA modification GTPase TrmE [Burkholderia pseudomallei]HDR9152713.1 50S ribosome-binding GTPase [Burkholderia vietnamiensis]
MISSDADKQIQLNDAIEEAIGAATKGLGKVNVVTVGKTGVGKSTLINTVFRGEFAKTGSGKPVTQKIVEITKPGHPLTIIDTKGLEVADYARTRDELDTLIQERSSSEDQNRHIHIAWLCIQEGSDRVEDAEVDLCNMIAAAGIPVVAVLTKSRKNEKFLSEVNGLLSRASSTVCVRALPERIEELDATLPPTGLDALIDATSRLIPEAQKRAYANALSTRNRRALDEKKRQSENEVSIAAGLAATAAAVPIPFSDAALLVPIQVTMIAKVGVTFGMELSTATLTTLVTSVLGASAATLIGRTVVSNLLKMIPGAGSVVGGTVAATTAALITKSLGNAYIAVLYEFCQAHPGEEIDIAMITKALKERVKI